MLDIHQTFTKHSLVRFLAAEMVCRMFRGRAVACPRGDCDVTTPGPRDFLLEAPTGDEAAEDLLAGRARRVVAGLHRDRGSRRTWRPSAHLAGHLRLAAVPGRADARVRAGQAGRSAAAQPGRRHAAGRTAGNRLAAPAPRPGPAARAGAGPDHGADPPESAAAHRQGDQHGQRGPAAQRRRQDGGPAGRGAHHGDRGRGQPHRRTGAVGGAAPPPNCRCGWPSPKSAAIPARRAGRPPCWPACPACLPPARACSPRR